MQKYCDYLTYSYCAWTTRKTNVAKYWLYTSTESICIWKRRIGWCKEITFTCKQNCNFVPTWFQPRHEFLSLASSFSLSYFGPPFWIFVEVSADNSFPDFRSPFPVPRSPLPAPRSPFPVLVTSYVARLKKSKSLFLCRLVDLSNYQAVCVTRFDQSEWVIFALGKSHF